MSEGDKPYVVHSGWVLKKKKKKIQGYAKRWFVLTSDGRLSYSMAPDKETRGFVDVSRASVSLDERQGTIHVDSGTTVFHLRMIQPGDLDEWRKQVRKFLHPWSAGADTGGDVGQGLRALDNAGESVREVMSTLNLISRAHPEDAQTVSGLIRTLMHIEHNQHLARQVLVRRARGEDSTESEAAPYGGSAIGGRSAETVNSLSGIDEGDFYDADEFSGVEYQIDEGAGARGDDIARDQASVDDEDDDDSDKAPSPYKDHHGWAPGGVEYRRTLPAPVSGDDVSLFAMLKKNVGKDLSSVSFPVSFNCPLSLLQAAAEEYEYAPTLLERAAQTKDWVERICLVGAFAVSGYACTARRASRKPFNPLLGETFECVRGDRRLRFVAEKVVHRPPVVATYAEGRGWHTGSWSSVKNKFWGKSLELIPEGEMRVELEDGDSFTITKPSSFMRNLLAGNKYLEHVGEMAITNEKTQQKLLLSFKEGSVFGGAASRNQIQGAVYDANDKVVDTVKGRWDEQVVRIMEKDRLHVLWEAEPFPPNTDDYYGFTYFAISLNEITEDIKNVLPPTDSRLRPDQHAFEEGHVEDAERLKQLLEAKQRSRRKALEEAGQAYRPMWFRSTNGSGPIEWVYGGPNGQDYFKERRRIQQEGGSNWPSQSEPIFDISEKNNA